MKISNHVFFPTKNALSQEHPIQFRPTYKYDPGTDNFDTSSKQRIPSYTDRIVYKHNTSSPVRPLHYDSVQGRL